VKVYLAGPINACSDAQVIAWREDAKLGIRRDFAVLDPADRDFRGVEHENVESIVTGDKADIDTSDVVLAMCWQPSYGTAMELLYAWQRGRSSGGTMKRIVVVVPGDLPISPWVEYHSDFVVRSLDAAIAWVNELA
jgi:nucleoside 2-deoxyribosyltransferase